MRNLLSTMSIILIFGIALNQSVYPQTTEITYQGNLDISGTPANDLFDFKFRLYNSLTGGTQLGNEVSLDDVIVSDGIFAVNLDFGYDFRLNGVYLEISVKSSRIPGAYTTLSPRQKITNSPHTIRSESSLDSDRLGGFTASNYVRTNTNSFIRNGTSPQTSANFNVSGTGTANRFIADTDFAIGISTPTNPFVAIGSGTDIGGVSGVNEVVGRFNLNATNRHTALSIDATSARDSVLYFSAGGEAKWGIRNDESTNEFQIRYHTGGANTSLLRLNKRETESGFDFYVNTDKTFFTGEVDIDDRLYYSYPNAVPGAVLCVDLITTGGLVGPCPPVPSSIRFKKDISNLSFGLDLVRQLRPVSFVWKDEGAFNPQLRNKNDFGLVAEEVAEIEPLLASYNPDGSIAGVKYDRVGVVLINAVKEQQTVIESLQKQVDEQEEIINKQQTEIDSLKKQQTEFEALKTLVCSQNQDAEICQTASAEAESETANVEKKEKAEDLQNADKTESLKENNQNEKN